VLDNYADAHIDGFDSHNGFHFITLQEVNVKKYNLHWYSGRIETITGNTIDEVFRNAGYGGGALSALDYYEEAMEVPMQYKAIELHESNKPEEIGHGTMFAKQLMEQLENGATRVFITIMHHEFICDVKVTPFKIICACIERKKQGEVVYNAA